MVTLNIKVTTVQPTEANGYLVAARGMLAGALPLENVQPLPVYALTLLCGHACEAALKAVLSQNGIAVNNLGRKPYGHNILHLWSTAIKVELAFPPPSWVARLNRVYDKPYHLRYPLGFQGIVLPNQKAMLKDTKKLVALATTYVRERSNA